MTTVDTMTPIFAFVPVVNRQLCDTVLVVVVVVTDGPRLAVDGNAVMFLPKLADEDVSLIELLFAVEDNIMAECVVE